MSLFGLCKHVTLTGAVLLTEQVKQLRLLFQKDQHSEVESPNILNDALSLVASEMMVLKRKER